jgi:hypothetical protein
MKSIACLFPPMFTDSTFDQAWKKANELGYVRMKEKDRYSSK